MRRPIGVTVAATALLLAGCGGAATGAESSTTSSEVEKTSAAAVSQTDASRAAIEAETVRLLYLGIATVPTDATTSKITDATRVLGGPAGKDIAHLARQWTVKRSLTAVLADLTKQAPKGLKRTDVATESQGSRLDAKTFEYSAAASDVWSRAVVRISAVRVSASVTRVTIDAYVVPVA